MPPSERNAAAADEQDEIVERKPSHPETTVLLIVAAVALTIAIALRLDTLGGYVNKRTREDLNQFQTTPQEWIETLPELAGTGGEGEERRPARRPSTPAPSEETPTEGGGEPTSE